MSRLPLVVALFSTLLVVAASAEDAAPSLARPPVEEQPPAKAQPPAALQTPVETLIDQLAQIDAPAPGLHGTATVVGFIGEDQPLKFGGGVLGSKRPTVPPAMRELTRRGVAALPLLIKHLSDSRPTRLTVGGTKGAEIIFMWQEFCDEHGQPWEEVQRRSFSGPYTVRVGDVCFAIIGQIVNRPYLPVRYQPSAGLVVNSPIEFPELAAQMEKEWGRLTDVAHCVSLFADARNAPPGQTDPIAGALTRLRFYHPKEYANPLLRKELGEKLAAFECPERQL